MIKMDKLPKINKKGKKRLGQGHGSGRGKTAGRGTKGQKSRGKMSLTFRSSGISIIRRLPLIRGKYRNKPRKNKPFAVNVKYLNLFPDKSVIDLNALISKHIVKKDEVAITGVKILGDGDLKVSLTVNLPCSKNAAKKIVAAGGKVELQK